MPHECRSLTVAQQMRFWNGSIRASVKETTPLDDEFKIHATIDDIPPLAVGRGGAECAESAIYSMKKYLTFPPEYQGRLKNCCFLVSLVLGLCYNRELKEAWRPRPGRVLEIQFPKTGRF